MKRIMFTGGSGKAGRHVVQDLLDHGYEVLNLDTKPLDNPKVRTLITDITDAGQVFNALSSYTGTARVRARRCAPPKIDAVVHFAAIPRIMLVPDNEVFRINAMGTYNIIEAATKLGIRKVIIASRETTYGVVFANEPRDPAYFPLDEDYPVDPMDSYALSKVFNERTAHAFAQRDGTDIYAMRIGNVIEPEEYARTSRNSSPIPVSASASPGAISTRAISARSSASPSRRTASASRSSTPSMTTVPRTCRRRSC